MALERPEGEGDSERGCASSDKPLWQDEELQEEIMAAKDIDLHVPKDRKRKGYNTHCIDGCCCCVAMFALETLVGVSLMRGVGGKVITLAV